MTTSPKSWVPLGICHVDAGMLMVGDPCYSAHDSHPEHPIHNWSAFCDLLYKDDQNPRGMQIEHPRGGAGCGVVVCTGGDGQYKVEARFNNHGDLLEMRVRPDRGEY